MWPYAVKYGLQCHSMGSESMPTTTTIEGGGDARCILTQFTNNTDVQVTGAYIVGQCQRFKVRANRVFRWQLLFKCETWI